ncbi:hypothetical protein F441_02193 [Phytophthora nicotianae CJ01A1]|uniref:Uncharacterized protein n=4 Tax=Phytophthora nicotianae TaxID=4792 RepID=W2QNW3_PHYN3|nr:hypothetical protein PPTG_07054 [Phytophthora nicotianae INRA-310]ETK94911.1 hypothetical protein L915_02130 [Phytophthora nicotianae]ETO83830.1 hypothetical protein F444_02226 [Phytophthora nicotianae P1976]ETP24874.1 hypothetical protein F441_02193 [Phytophthora nicotianae CJ01A1]ETL48304.1 hypothetical protein L916_02094 [Phytophthora nicotianae]ETM54593.1 hypothetical protein L914_02111 [Phytophthora nicotianae]
MAIVAEDDGFVVERASFSIAPRNSSHLHPPPTSKHTDPLSTFEFVAVWLLVLALHGLCASYLLAMAMLYFFMENPLMAYYANLLALPEHRYFCLFGTLVGILGALHGLQLVLHLLWSIKSRAPAVFPRATLIHRLVKKIVQRSKRAQPVAPRTTWSRNSITAIGSVTASGLQNVLSVEGTHFAVVFVVRKAVEAGAQVVQCYRYSTLIGRVWINQAYAGMVVTNCWVTPLLDYLMLASESQAASTRKMDKAKIAIRERVACVSIDALLTTFACLILPLTIFVPYAQVFDASWYGFPSDILYGDVSFPNLIRENQALFALTFIDGVTKLVPHLSILFGMASISLVLELYPPQRFTSTRKAKASVVVVRSKSRKMSKALKQSSQAHVVGLYFLRRFVAPLSFMTAGAVVLGLHLHAAHLASSADANTMELCLQGLRPWFAVNVSCSVLKFNCYKQGVLTPSDQLDHLQSDAVMAVIFEHCSAFEMPLSIRNFRNLLGLELWNVSIVNWGEKAALNADLHPEMIFLIMVYTNMTEIPRGLLTTPLPPLLGDIEISVTNLTIIPDNLADAWSNVRLVYLEHAPLKEFPTAFFKIPSLSVSLIDDGLESIPDDLFTTMSRLDEYLEIAFSYNPIKNLPSSIRDGLLINYLSVDHTELIELPTWVGGIGQWMSLGGAPVCNITEAVIPDIADCTDWGWNPMADGRYPLALVAPLRKIV